MRFHVIFAFAFAISLAFMANASAEPDVTAVQVNPSQVDNQVDEQVDFQGDCSICQNDEDFSYFYWNSSIDGILKEGISAGEIMFSKMSFVLSTTHRYLSAVIEPSPMLINFIYVQLL